MSNFLTFSLPPWLAQLLPILTLLGITWKARGYFDKLVTNHLAHAKQDILEAVATSAKVDDEGHKEIVKAVNEGTNRVVDTLITLQR